MSPVYYDAHRDYYRDLPNNAICVSETFATSEFEDNSFYKIQINVSLQKYADLHKLCCYLKEDNSNIPKELLNLIVYNARQLTEMEQYFYSRLDDRDIKEDLLDIAKTIISTEKNNLNILCELSEACAPYSDLKMQVLKNIHKSSCYYHKAQLELALCVRYNLLYIENLSAMEYLVFVDQLIDYIKNLDNRYDMWFFLEKCERDINLWMVVLKAMGNTLAVSEPNNYITYLQEQNKELTEQNNRLKTENKLLQKNNIKPSM